jgi:AraC-like DNA-binding protein
VAPSMRRPLRRETLPALYGKLRYDPRLEAEALARLADVDLEGCREALRRLVDRLDLAGGGVPPRQSLFLLVNLLLMVSARVHRVGTDEEAHHASRAAILERFLSYEDPEEARQAFLPTLNRLLAALRPPAPGSHPHLVELAQAYVEENYHHRVSLATVAAHLHVSRNYLSRLFRHRTGATLTAYVHRVRLEHARALLAAGGRSIAEIAYLVGYQNYRDFYRNFTKYEHAPPRQVQRRLASRPVEPAGSAPRGDNA